MTHEEAAQLVKGQIVEIRERQDGHYVWVKARVIHATLWQGRYGSILSSIRMSRVENNGKTPVVTRYADSVRHPFELDPVTANAFSDWLEEHDEHRAADLLRQAFPFVDAKGNTEIPALQGEPKSIGEYLERK